MITGKTQRDPQLMSKIGGSLTGKRVVLIITGSRIDDDVLRRILV